jgi:hypothetical protein
VLDHLAVTPTADQLVLGQMRKNRADGPLAGRRPPTQHFVRRSLDQASQRVRRLALHRDRISIPDIRIEPGPVLVGILNRPCIGHCLPHVDMI